jgi:hypothetical protein
LVRAAGGILIGVGILLVVVGIAGCWGACAEKTGCLTCVSIALFDSEFCLCSYGWLFLLFRAFLSIKSAQEKVAIAWFFFINFYHLNSYRYFYSPHLISSCVLVLGILFLYNEVK